MPDYIKNINKNILTEYGRTLFFPSNFCSQSSNTGDSEYVSELFFLGNVLLKVLEFDTAKIKRKKNPLRQGMLSIRPKIFI